MKRCPQCKRDYYDDSLLYCLDDGASLLEGPASFEPLAEIISGQAISDSEAQTELQIGDEADSQRAAASRIGYMTKIVVGICVAAIILGVGVFGYRSLDPNYATVHEWYAEYLLAMDRNDEALTEARMADLKHRIGLP